MVIQGRNGPTILTENIQIIKFRTVSYREKTIGNKAPCYYSDMFIELFVLTVEMLFQKAGSVIKL